jgi:hypothetical protein
MSRLGSVLNNELLNKLQNPEINSDIINRYLKAGANPNMTYQNGTHMITQAIYNLGLAKAQSNNNLQNNCLQIIKTLINSGAILDENDETKLNSLEPNWKAIIGYSSNKTNTMLASDIITHEIPYGQYVEAGTEKDLQQYMGPKGGRSRKHRRKLRHSRSKRGGRKRSSRSGRKRSGRSRKLKGG